MQLKSQFSYVERTSWQSGRPRRRLAPGNFRGGRDLLDSGDELPESEMPSDIQLSCDGKDHVAGGV